MYVHKFYEDIHVGMRQDFKSLYAQLKWKQTSKSCIIDTPAQLGFTLTINNIVLLQ